MSQAYRNSKVPESLRPNVPIAFTSFVGRKRELAEVGQALVSSQLVTLTGAAGCGKTRLALQVAANVNQQYPDGVHWVDLARLMDPALVPKTAAKVFRIAEQSGRPTLEGFLDALHDKQLLLVLDNCEHVLSACTQLVEGLMASTSVSILATSREPLGVVGEMRYVVLPMGLPPINVPEERLGEFDVIQLFVERARTILPSFDLTAENAGDVAHICRRVDGIPLALELASARVNVLTVQQIAARLDDQFVLLAAVPHFTQSHHRTLRGAIDWSYDLLSTPEQHLLQRLAVFVGGCSLATVETICVGDGIEQEQVLDLLSALVNKSLVVAKTLHRGEARYSLLETIRQYAHEQLVNAGNWPALRDHHLDCFLQITGDMEPKLRGRYQHLWLDWLEGEFDNIRAALTWSLEGEHIEAGLRIVIAIYQFWTIRDYVEEGFAWLEQLLAEADERISPLVLATALGYAVTLAGFRGNTAAQAQYGRAAARLAEEVGEADKAALAWALSGQAYAARAVGDFTTEYALNQRVIQLRRELGDRYVLGVALSTHSFSAMSVGEYDEARERLDEALPIVRETGNPYRIAMALNFSGDLARCQEDYRQARTAYEQSLLLLRQIDAVRDLASVLHNLGHAWVHLGDVERAHAFFIESMTIQQAQRNTPGVAECLIGFAALAVVCGLPGAGARLLAAAVATGGQRITTAWAATRKEYEHILARVRSSLTEAEFESEQGAGRTFSLEQATEYALNLRFEAAARQVDRSSLDHLTKREREVAGLIAEGKSNGAIADELVVSKRTVEKHIATIRSKLGFTERTEIVRWAIGNNLRSRDE